MRVHALNLDDRGEVCNSSSKDHTNYFFFDVIIVNFGVVILPFLFQQYKRHFLKKKSISTLSLFEGIFKVYHIFLSKFLLVYRCYFPNPGFSWALRCWPYYLWLHSLKKIISSIFLCVLKLRPKVDWETFIKGWCLLKEDPYKLRWEYSNIYPYACTLHSFHKILCCLILWVKFVIFSTT